MTKELPPNTDAKPIAPLGASKKTIQEFAEKVAAALEFQPGEALEAIVSRLGGKLEIGQLFEEGEYESGSIEVRGERDFTILLAYSTSPLRDRFTVAHELGHYFLHSMAGKNPLKVARAGSHRVEWEANWFAASFLMPEQVMQAKHTEFDGLVYSMAHYFMVSTRAIEVRCKDLGLKVRH